LSRQRLSRRRNLLHQLSHRQRSLSESRSCRCQNPPTAFVSEINPASTALIYSTLSRRRRDFPVTADAFQSVNKGAKKLPASTFVAELKPTGGALVCSTFFLGSGSNNGDGTYKGAYGCGIALDSDAKACVTGSASSPDFPVSTGALQSKAGASINAYVAKCSTAASPTTATPECSPAAGTCTGAQSVTITDTTTDATICYTTNAATPTDSSPKYTVALRVIASETIKAIAIATAETNSAIATEKYTIK
jgi:hypothetical protein